MQPIRKFDFYGRTHLTLRETIRNYGLQRRRLGTSAASANRRGQNASRPRKRERYTKTPPNDEQTLARHLVKLGRVVDVNLERDARVLSLLARGAFEDVIVPLGQTPSHGFPDVAHEGLVVNSDDLEVKASRVLPNAEDVEHVRSSLTRRPREYRLGLLDQSLQVIVLLKYNVRRWHLSY